jgi:hypothetical protein
MRADAALALIVSLVACGGTAGHGDPWLAPDTIDAEHWGLPCGTTRIAAYEDPKVPSDQDGFIWVEPSGWRDPADATCALYRDKRTGALRSLDVSVIWQEKSNVRIALARIESLRAMLLAQVKPEYRPWVLVRSLGMVRQDAWRLLDHYDVWGGYRDGESWDLSVRHVPRR